MRIYDRLRSLDVWTVAGVTASATLAILKFADAHKRTCPRRAPVLLIGDSHAMGLNAPLLELARGCGVNYTGDAIGGSGAPLWAPKIGPLLEQTRPRLVIASLASNDYRHTEPERVREAVARIVGAVRSSGARLLWLSPPSYPPGTGYDVDRIGAVRMWRAHKPAEFRMASDLPRQSDQIHFTPAGYREQARRAWLTAAQL